MSNVIEGAFDIDFLEVLTLTIAIELTILESLPLTYWDWSLIIYNYWHWGQNYWPYYKKSIIIDKTQYIDIEENQDIDIVIDIETGQWLYATIDIDIDIEVTTIDPIIKSQ